MLWTSGGDLFWPKVKSGSRNRQMSLIVKQLFYQFFINYGRTNQVNGIIFVLVAPHIYCVIYKTKKSEICREMPEL
jgi:hypothetical protein